MYSTHTATLQIPLVPQAAKEAHTFVELGDTSLVSLGPLVDAGCTDAQLQLMLHPVVSPIKASKKSSRELSMPHINHFG